MLIKNLDNYKLVFYEFLTLVFFIGISYAYLNKIILYEALGISWLIGSLTPNYVLVSSLGFIFFNFCWCIHRFIVAYEKTIFYNNDCVGICV